MRHSRSRRDVPPMISILASLGAVLCTGQVSASGDVAAEVVANGSGCPANSWVAHVAGDGASITLAFDAYRATVSPQAAADLKSCQLAIRLPDMQSKAYAVESFSYESRVVLSAGVRGKFTSNYYFQGSPDDAQRIEVQEFAGPLHQNSQLVNSIALEDLKWSTCGEQRDLNVQTDLVLTNNSDVTGSGAMYLTSTDWPGSLILRLAIRAC